MLTRTHRYLASTMAQTRDPDGFARLRELAAAGPAGGAWATRRSPRPGSRRCWPARAAHRRDHRRRLRRAGRHPAAGACPRRAEEGRLLPAAAGTGHLPRRRAGHHPRVRAGRRAADHRGTGRPLPAAVHAGPRPDRGLPAGAAARAGLRQPGRDLAAPWPGCSGPGSKPWRRASTPCASHRRSPGRGRRTWRPIKRTITDAGRATRSSPVRG